MHHFSRPFQQQCWAPRSTSWVPVARGLISYGPNFIDQYRFAASYVDRILKCKKRPIFQYRRRPSTSGRQSQNRQGDRRDNPTVIACERRRGDRIGRAIAAMHESGIGTKRSLRCSRRMSVVGGEAENMCSARVFRLWTRCGHFTLTPK